MFVSGEAPVRAGIRWQRSKHVQRVVILDVDPVGRFHDAAVLVPVDRGSRVPVGVAAQRNVAVRCELGAVRKFQLNGNRHWRERERF